MGETMTIRVGPHEVNLEPKPGKLGDEDVTIWRGNRPKMTTTKMRQLAGKRVEVIRGGETIAVGKMEHQPERPSGPGRKGNAGWKERVVAALQLAPLERLTVRAVQTAPGSDRAVLICEVKPQVEPPPPLTEEEREAKRQERYEKNRQFRQLEKERDLAKRKWLTISEAADVLGVKYGTVWQYVKRGVLEAIKADKMPGSGKSASGWGQFTGVWWVKKSSVEAYKAKRDRNRRRKRAES